MQEEDTASPAISVEPVVEPVVVAAPDARPPFRRWRAVALATVAAVLALVVGVALVLVAEPDRSRARPAEADPLQTRALSDKEILHRDAVVSATLVARARAVVDRDRKAFMADVDRRDRSFLKAQEQLFDNLVQVPFHSWRYELTKQGYERPELAQKYGNTPIYLPPLVLRYAIRGYDEKQKPVAVPLVMTFVMRGDDWQIASDSDVDVDLPRGGHAEPWDRRPMVVGEGKHVLVLADADDRGDLDELVKAGDVSVRHVARVWPTRWRKKVVISAVRDQHLIETYFRSELQSSENVAAIAVPVATEVTGWVNDRSADDEPELAGFRVIINPRYFDAGDDSTSLLLTHEIAHVATGSYTWDGAPTWLVEGAAEYTAYQAGAVFDGLPQSVQKQVDAGSVALPGYEFYQRDVEANYLVGHLACHFIARKYGEGTLRKLYRRLGDVANEIHTLEEQEKAFQDLLGLSTPAFERQLARHIKNAQ